MKPHYHKSFLILMVIAFTSIHPKKIVAQLDPGFNVGGSGANSIINCVAIQSDGKILIAGKFVQYNGTAINRIARLTPNGAIDNTFNIGSGASDFIYAIAIQSNGRILVGGSFTEFNGTAVNRLVRLNSDGSIDNTFNVGSGASDAVRSLLIQPNGKIIVGGRFSQFNGVAKGKVVRLNSNGSIDNTFNADGSGANASSTIYTIARQSNGKIVLGGTFVQFNTKAVNRILRLSSAGTFDSTFNSGGTGANLDVRVIKIQPDNKILAGGLFTQFNSSQIRRITRLNSNGSIDTSFNSGGIGANDGVLSIAIQSDQKIILGGDFAQFNSTAEHRILRLTPSGNLDGAFEVGNGASSSVNDIAFQPDSGIIVVGAFPQFDNTSVGRIARLLNLGAIQTSGILWQKSYGGTEIECPGFNAGAKSEIRQTPDKGYIVAGTSESNDGDVSGNHGGQDGWIVKLDSIGAIEWQKSIGGSDDDLIHCVDLTSDGGYILAGETWSNDGGVSGNHGGLDVWVVKMNSSGEIVWQKCYGGSNYDVSYSIQETSDHGFIVGASASSLDGDVVGNHSDLSYDFWLIKLNSQGNKVWAKCYGGIGNEIIHTVKQLSGGGYIAAGWTTANGGDVSSCHGGNDYWVVKVNSQGALQWAKCFGGTGDEIAYGLDVTSDNGYILSGQSTSNDDDVSGNHGGDDYWIVKLSTQGNIVWQKSFGGSAGEISFSIKQIPNNEFIVSGYSDSNDGDVLLNHGLSDYWIIKIDENANILWQQSYGGSGTDVGYEIERLPDGSFIVTGYSYSHNGDVSGNHGSSDYWVAKFTTDDLQRMQPATYKSPVTIFPNPTAGNFTVSFDVERDEYYEIQIANSIGQVVGSEKKLLTRGQSIYKSSFNEPPGLYYITITSPDFKETLKLLKQ